MTKVIDELFYSLPARKHRYNCICKKVIRPEPTQRLIIPEYAKMMTKSPVIRRPKPHKRVVFSENIETMTKSPVRDSLPEPPKYNDSPPRRFK